MPKDMSGGPLTQFQAKVADRDRTFELVQSLNTALDAAALPLETLKRQFDRVWPELEKVLSAPLAAHPVAPKRDMADTLGEILEIARELKRNSVLSATTLADEVRNFASVQPVAKAQRVATTWLERELQARIDARDRVSPPPLGATKAPEQNQRESTVPISATEESVPAKNTDRKEKPKRRRK